MLPVTVKLTLALSMLSAPLNETLWSASAYPIYRDQMS